MGKKIDDSEVSNVLTLVGDVIKLIGLNKFVKYLQSILYQNTQEKVLRLRTILNTACFCWNLEPTEVLNKRADSHPHIWCFNFVAWYMITQEGMSLAELKKVSKSRDTWYRAKKNYENMLTGTGKFEDKLREKHEKIILMIANEKK